jgi:hypothetical protein
LSVGAIGWIDSYVVVLGRVGSEEVFGSGKEEESIGAKALCSQILIDGKGTHEGAEQQQILNERYSVGFSTKHNRKHVAGNS